jgi:hypothetical protein
MSDGFVEEVLRINERYLVEFVERFGICPFAAATRTGGALHRRVVESAAVSAAQLVPLVDEAAATPASIALLILPRYPGSPDALDTLCNELRRLVEARGPAVFALAPFHPDAPYSTASPRQLVLFFRRSPDPTLQLVRFSVLDEARRAAPSGKFLMPFTAQAFRELERRVDRSLSDRIAGDNHARVITDGIEPIRAVLDDIRADRARSYARFLHESPQRG